MVFLRSSFILFSLVVSTIVSTEAVPEPGTDYDSGLYTWTSAQQPATTAYYYTTYYTPSTSYTTFTTYAGVTVTITSIIPCPVTSTVVYYECCAGCNTKCNPEPNPNTGGAVTYIGTTTVTSYTTTTPSAVGVQTITSGGLVIVVVDSATPTQSVVTQTFVNDAPNEQTGASIWGTMVMFLLVVGSIMILL